MKVLLLNQAFYPDIVATSQQASDLATRLVELGHQVTVVSSRRAYDNPAQRYPRREVWRGIQIRRISSFSFGKTARWRRALDFGSYMANCLMRLTTLPKADIVIALTSPPLISWLGAVFTRLKGGRFIFWVMDLNPDEALAAGWLRPESRATKTLEGLLHYSLRRATTIVALDRYMAKRIEDKGISASKIAVLPPWAQDHLVHYDSDGRGEFRKTHKLDDKFVVMYSGNHSPCHPLTTLLQAARKLKARPDIMFCFVGGGSEFQTVKRFAAEHALSNVTTIPYQPVSALSASLSSADLHVVVMGEPFVGIIHPCKVYNIRALGIPYLYIGPAESHVSEMAPPFSAAHGDVDGVVRQIESAVRSALVGTARSRESRQRMTNDYGHEHLVSRMIRTLEMAAATS